VEKSVEKTKKVCIRKAILRSEERESGGTKKDFKKERAKPVPNLKFAVSKQGNENSRKGRGGSLRLEGGEKGPLQKMLDMIPGNSER